MQKDLQEQDTTEAFEEIEEPFTFVVEEVLLDFAVDDTIIGYQPDLKGIEKSSGKKHSYTYLEDFASVGIPSERYNWFRSEAAKATGKKIDNNSLNQNDGYTWIYACIMKNLSPATCCIYSRDKDGLETVGSLHQNALVLKSNMVGIGHFRRVAVLKTRDVKYVLWFILEKLQLKNKTQKCSKMEIVSRVEPPADVQALFKNI